MNATRKSSKLLTLLIACWLTAAGAAAQAPLTANAPEGSQPRLDRQGVDAVLAEARRRMAAGDLAAANALVTRAEEARVSYPLLHNGDTPSKARRDLDRALAKAPAQDPFLSASSSAVTLPDPPAVGDRYAAPAATTPPTKQQAAGLLAQARAAMEGGDLAAAERLAAEASRLGLPESAFGKNEDSPTRIAWDLQRRRAQGAVTNAAAALPLADTGRVDRADYTPEADTTRLSQASSQSGPSFFPLPPTDQPKAPQRVAQLPSAESTIKLRPSAASELLMEGERALVDRQTDKAYDAFRRAAERRSDLTQFEQQRLDAHLELLSGTPAPPETPTATPRPISTAQAAAPKAPAGPQETLIDAATAKQQLLARQQSTAVGQAQVEARSIREQEPRRALEMLEEVKAEVLASGLSKEYADQLARRVDRSIAETKRYIEDNRAQIELDEKNAAVLAEIDRESAAREKVRETIAEDVDKFNRLIDEQRFEEAEVVAMRLREVAPDHPVVAQLWQQAKFIRRSRINEDQLDRRDTNNWRMWNNVEESAIPDVFDGEEMAFDSKRWEDLQKRKGFSDRSRDRSEREIEIERRLKTPVQLRFEDRPLSEVVESLSQMTGVNIHLDPRGLNQEGVSSDTPVTINVTNEIMLKSALNLILEPLHLGYTVKDEVLKITSETLRDGEVEQRVYYVADLVIPIPNFVPSNNIGLQGLINDALAVTGPGSVGIGGGGPTWLANAHPSAGPGGAQNNPDVLAQNFSAGGSPQVGAGAVTTGPGGLGGAAQADFDSLIDLIVSTVASDTWAENGGGEAEIRPFATNLSLVISQTQSVHEEIADLLEQLRRLQDLQVTIEVRFITLRDDFFERIGLDFDVNINDSTSDFDALASGVPGIPGDFFEPPSRSGVVGAEAPLVGDLATVTADLDVPFRQGSFSTALPAFGGFSPTDVASFGFAILSEIEAYFLIEAAQGDSRSNVLSAPKVTLFNGQQAFVSDTSQSPFVISVIPVVGEFAAAQQPVIVVLSEGTLLSIQAVVSDDRRYVRLTVVPFFSTIGDVDTFTFDGSTSTSSSSSSSSTDDDDDGTSEAAANAANADTIVAGTTVQLPTFSFTSVTTTVSVPDGGTVLLGGIKELSEGREEFGIPLLSKVPYINRLFRNVGIGRETSTFMMMVTPRIIIQEEEEERLGLASQ